VKVTDDGVPVSALITTIKDSIKQAGVSRASGSNDLRVGSVRLILEVVASTSTGGGLDFCVPFIGMKLKLGGNVTKQNAHTMDIVLVPPPETETRVVRGGDIETALVDAIITIRQTMASAAGGDDPWVLSEATIDICFAITKTGTISIGADGELTGEVTHTIRLGLVPGQQG
jgi:NTP-dependent ternary system trypsin peptidase co-occuring protein